MKTLQSLDLAGKRVIMRVDFNVPIQGGRVKDVYRIQASIPTINAVLKKGASIVLIAHLGRPDGIYQKNLSLKPVARAFSKLIHKKVFFFRNLEEAKMLAPTLRSGEIAMIENIRFFSGEAENAPALAKRLASLGDAYVNDAFGDAHRAHASIVGIPKYLPHAAGLLLQKEVEALGRVFVKPKRPVLAILGGAKIKSKLPLIERFLKKADGIIVGGVIANTILAAKHIAIGKSKADTDVDISWLHLTNKKFYMPIDALVAQTLEKSARTAFRAITDIREHEYIADIGPDSVRLFSELIKKAGTIIWNGPLGFIEIPAFSKGTEAIVKSVSKARGFTIVGGGDLNRVVDALGLQKKFDHVSTGGGAMLEFLSGKKLPGIEALK